MISIEKVNIVIKKFEFDGYSEAKKYLLSLTFEEVKSLQVLMYLGRDKDYNKEDSWYEIYRKERAYFDDLGWNTKVIEVDCTLKLPLVKYLSNAKTILNITE